MKLARVIGTVTAAVKDAQLAGSKLLVCDIVDGNGQVLEPAIVAVDTVGAGVGENVLVVFGSAARLPAGASALPTDAAITAIVDHVKIG